MELNRSYFQLEKELIAECLDVASTRREVRPLESMISFGYHSGLSPRSFSVISLHTWVMCNCLGSETRHVVHSLSKLELKL